MSGTTLCQYSLILYKNRPGRITHTGKKLEIEVEGGRTLKVRPKDVTLLHPGPIHSLAELAPPAGEAETAWELLAGETTTLAELAELAYGDFTPAAAWAAWRLVADGLYFSGSPAEIVAHTPADVARKQATREAKAAAEEAWTAFLKRAQAGRYLPQDGRYLQEVAALAWGQQEKSRVLRALGHTETPQNAHALLLALGYWDDSDNPYPQREGVSTTPPAVTLPDLPDEPRRDLTHLTALAIDDEGARDPDDAVSLEDGRLWVHIADVAALVAPGSTADVEARARGASLYLPEGTVPMLPPEAAQRLGLGLAEISPALSFGVDTGRDGEIEGPVLSMAEGLEIVPSWVCVTRLTYAEAEVRIEETPLRELYRLAQTYQARRRQNGAIEIDLPEVRVRVEEGQVVIRPIPSLRSRALVREAMLMAGEAVARFALEHDIPLPFTVQDAPETEVEATGLAGMFARRRTLKPGRQQSAPALHAGLGMPMYVQATSPLRRYLDLVVHQQLRAYLRGDTLLDAQTIMERVGAAAAVSGSARWAERQSNEHWKLVYLKQHPDWRGQGVIVDKRGKRDLILIPDLDLETQIYRKKDWPLNGIMTLSLSTVNLAALETRFRVD